MSATHESPTLSSFAVSQLREEILSGAAVPGTRLAEAAVAERLDVSRVPVREALFSLEREGLVVFSATGRAFVKELTAADFEELFLLRLTLEPLAARLAAPVLRADVTRLEKNIASTRKARNLPAVTRLDLEFHELIVESSANERLLKLWRSIRGELELWLARLHRTHHGQKLDTREGTAGSHSDIVECFRSQTPAACERLMREHILGWREWLPG